MKPETRKTTGLIAFALLGTSLFALFDALGYATAAAFAFGWLLRHVS